MSTVDRLNDTEYINWLKLGVCLMEIRPLLSALIETRLEDFHLKLKEKRNDKRCSSRCSVAKDQKLTHLCEICREWSTVIKSYHKKPKSYIYWNNCKPFRWCDDALEVAKAYMPSRQEDNNQMSDFDIAALLVLMKQCTHFEKLVPESVLDKIQDIRNTLMHSPDMKISSTDAEGFFKDIFMFFEAMKSTDPLLEETVCEVENKTHKICRSPLNISLREDLKNREIAVFKENILALHTGADKDSFQEVNLILLRRQEWCIQNGNPQGLAELLNKVRDELKKDFTEIKQKVDCIDHKLQNIDERVAQLEDPQNPKKLVMYKNDLISLAQKKRWETPLFSEDIKNYGYVGKVRVNGVEYKGETVYPSKVDAHQEVSKIALEELKNELEKQERSVIPHPRPMLNLPSDDKDGKRFSSEVTCELKGTFVKSSGSTEEEAIQSSYRRIGLALGFLNPNSDVSQAKNIVQETSRSDLVISEDSTKEGDVYTCKLKLNGNCQFKGQGDDKKQAEKNAAKKAFMALVAMNQVQEEQLDLTEDSKLDYKGKLQSFFQKKKRPLPSYDTKESGSRAAGISTENETNLPNHSAENIGKSFIASVTVRMRDVRISTDNSFTIEEEAKQSAFTKLGFVLGANESEENAERFVQEYFSKSKENKIQIGYEHVQNTLACVLTFTVQCTFTGQDHASSRKSAHENAAKEGLRRLAPVSEFHTGTSFEPMVNYRNRLQELFQKANQELPTYEIIHNNAVEEFRSTVTIYIKELDFPEEYDSEHKAVEEACKKLDLVLNSAMDRSQLSASKARIFECLGKDSVKEKIVKVANKYKCQLILNTPLSFEDEESAASKTSAEQQVAWSALQKLRPLLRWNDSNPTILKKNYKGALQELVQEKGQTLPSYSTRCIYGSPSNKTDRRSVNPVPIKNMLPISCYITEDEERPKTVEELTVALAKHNIQKYFTYSICKGYASSVIISKKNIMLESLEWCDTEEEALNTSYKMLGRTLYDLGQISDRIETRDEIKNLFERKQLPHPQETWKRKDNELMCCLEFSMNLSFKGYGKEGKMAKEDAAKNAFAKLAPILKWDTNENDKGPAERYVEILERHLRNDCQYEESSCDLYSGDVVFSFRDFTVCTKQTHPSKRSAQKEVCERLASVLGLNVSDISNKIPLKNRIQEWFQKDNLPIPKYEDDAVAGGGFKCKTTFTAKVVVREKDCLPTPDFLEEVLHKSALQRLKLLELF
ncbi:uncharacterized protein [Lepisosteus oculatus]|uniref:uncharacterized protein isoform X1 n=2 Tax=Lepisosteus oculatus TaxID=7918 RepID=UPI0037132E02